MIYFVEPVKIKLVIHSLKLLCFFPVCHDAYEMRNKKKNSWNTCVFIIGSFGIKKTFFLETKICNSQKMDPILKTCF